MQSSRTWLKRILILLYAWFYLTGRYLERRPRIARIVFGGLFVTVVLLFAALYITRPTSYSTDAGSTQWRDALQFLSRARPTPTRPPTATPSPTPTVPPALRACDPDRQARAMRAGDAPDWTTLPLTTCYDLALHLQPSTRSYTGTARITYSNRTGMALSELVFRTYPNAPVIYGGRLTVTTALLEGTPLTPESFLTDETGLRLSLPLPLPSDATARVELEFRGQIPEAPAGENIYGIFTYSSADRMLTLANWYPMLAPRRDGAWYAEPVIAAGDPVVSDVALYQVRISAPAGWAVVTTGSALPSADTGTQTFVSGPARDFMVLAGSSFTRREAHVDGVHLIHWGIPDGELVWDEALTVARDAFETYEARFGPYPYAELDLATVPLNTIMGMEYPGLSLIDADLYENGTQRPFLPIMTAHEVAHQWWYGVVGNDARKAPWQDEGLTEFSALLYFQEHQPEQYNVLLQRYTNSVAGFQQTRGEEPLAQPSEAFIDRREAYQTVAYYKGLLFFKELYDRLGEDRFLNALHTYYRDNRYGIAPPAALLRSFEQRCDCDLRDLYGEWGVLSQE